METGKINSPRFSTALWQQYHAGKIPIIPDIKVRSPRDGDLLPGRDPAAIAEILAAAGAPAISVVTEPRYFGGSLQLLQRIARTVSLPILRKDFIDSREQMQESLDLGASAVLLIASMLEKEQLHRLIEEAGNLGLEVLLETHNEAEVLAANELPLSMLGINNRNIVQLEIDNGDVSNTEKLARLVQSQVLVVSESSINTEEDVRRAAAAGAHGVLVGTAILRADQPAKMYNQLREAGVNICPE